MFVFDSFSTDSKVHFEENQKKCDVENQEGKKIGFTKGESTSIADLRCDYIIGLYVAEDLNAASINEVVFLELKGKDVTHALEQIRSTYQNFESDFERVKYKTAIVVAKSYSPKMKTKIQNMILKLRKLGVTTNKAENIFLYKPKV